MCDLSAAPPSRDPDSTISFAPRDSAPLEPNGGGCGRRRKLWELEPHCHCAVLGTCLPVKVLRQIYTQIQGEAPVHLSDYQIHSLFVKEASAPCAAIRRVHKALEARYRVAVQRFAKAKDEAELTALWEVAVVNEEEVAGAYWALMTHPRLSKILAARAFGDVHMLSHLAGRCRQRSARQQQQLERRCRELQSQLAERSTALCRLQRERHDERRTLEKAQQALREREATIAYLEAQLVALETTTELADLRRQLAAAERRAQWAEGRLAALASEVPPAVEAEPETISPPPVPVNPEPPALPPCPTPPNLCGRCILYVGGRQGCRARLQRLVEAANGRFLYHDGGREDASARLGELLERADAVICPLNCISHNAVNGVKRRCRRAAKPVVMVKSPSLAALNAALHRLPSAEAPPP